MKIIVRKFGCFKNFLLYLETLLHIARLVFVIRKKLMSESSQNSTQILLDGKNGSPNSKQHRMFLNVLLQNLQLLFVTDEASLDGTASAASRPIHNQSQSLTKAMTL